MILDSGICTIFGQVDTSEPGGMPVIGYEIKTQGWFGVLDYATAEAWPTEGREETEVSLRIRILQDRRVTNRDTVILQEIYEVAGDVERYEVTRAYHGHDDDSGEPITDLTLRRVSV